MNNKKLESNNVLVQTISLDQLSETHRDKSLVKKSHVEVT